MYATTSLAPYAVAELQVLFQVKDPEAPVSPLGIVKSKVAADVEPEFVTITLDPASPVDTVPTAIVAAFPVFPCGP